MKVLFIINDRPYGPEGMYNALRRAHALAKKEPSAEATLFLMANAVLATKGLLRRADADASPCRQGPWPCPRTCIDARGLSESEIMEGARRSTMHELASAATRTDKVLVF
jgi:uncharacterized protein involved in oxidation of intracellular sulfur